jgi:hypothetical protein
MPRRTGATDKQEPLSQSLTAVGRFFQNLLERWTSASDMVDLGRGLRGESMLVEYQRNATTADSSLNCYRFLRGCSL